MQTSASEVDNETIDSLSPLRPEEIPEGYHRWVEKRQREYRAGRHHARLALTSSGVEAPKVRRGDDGLPLFPEGWNGSITHTGRSSTYAAAAICTSEYRVGLDAENHKRLSDGMIDAIMLPLEQRRYHQETSREARAPSELGDFGLWVFSMKEAFYKCTYPYCAAPFGFLDLDVHVDTAEQRFLVSFLSTKYPDVPRHLTGRYVFDTQRIVCGVTWKPDSESIAPGK